MSLGFTLSGRWTMKLIPPPPPPPKPDFEARRLLGVKALPLA
ncbi:hypothetical protein A7982_12134 [Minicystis rosea]|nr:hypothetical protein A7982_12134 [Minicystis rosea]